MPVSKYDAKMVSVHRETEQRAKDTVQFYRMKNDKGTPLDGPLTMRDFFNQASLWYVLFLQEKNNGGKQFPHCTKLKPGKIKR
jgi:hypothetical protein